MQDYSKLLKVIQYFCVITSEYDLYNYHLNETFKMTSILHQQNEWLKKEVDKISSKNVTHQSLILISKKIYEKGYSGLDLIKIIEKYNTTKIDEKKLYELLFLLNKIRKELRNEKLIILFILNFLFM